MRIDHLVLLVLAAVAAPVGWAQTATGIWEGKVGGNAQQTLRIDLDTGLASLNSGSPFAMTVVKSDDPLAIQFDLTISGRTLRFTGRRSESEITGSIANRALTLTRLPGDTPHLAGRQRYPFPQVDSGDAKAVATARAALVELIRKQEIPGLSVAVARKGKILWSEGFGLADVEHGTPVTPLTRFRVGSVSKVLTAAGIGRLVEQGKLDLDAPIRRYVPDFPAKPWPITTRQLAAHTAGIRHYNSAEAIGPKGAPHFARVRLGLALFENDPLLFEPGTSYSYSSYGWSLISAVMEGASRQEFLSFMRSSVFEPLGLHSIVPDHVDAIVPHRTRFYVKEGPGRPLENAPYVDLSYVWAGGGYLATAEDLVRFGAAHLQPGFFEQRTLDLLFKGQSVIPEDKRISVGVGWRIQTDSEGRRILHHAGASVGGRAMLLLYPDSGITVAILSNTLADFGPADAQRIGSLFVAN